MIDNYLYASNYTDRGSNGRDTKKGWERGILTPPWTLIGPPTAIPYIAFVRPPAFDSGIEKAGFRFPEREGRVIYASWSATKQAADRGAALKLRGTKPR